MPGIFLNEHLADVDLSVDFVFPRLSLPRLGLPCLALPCLFARARLKVYPDHSDSKQLLKTLQDQFTML